MHGARGGAPEGKRNGNYRHGGRTKEMIEVWKLIKSFLWLMSAFGGKADIGHTLLNVCFWPKADMSGFGLLLRKLTLKPIPPAASLL
jgi:hypothetical protein